MLVDAMALLLAKKYGRRGSAYLETACAHAAQEQGSRHVWCAVLLRGGQRLERWDR